MKLLAVIAMLLAVGLIGGCGVPPAAPPSASQRVETASMRYVKAIITRDAATVDSMDLTVGAHPEVDVDLPGPGPFIDRLRAQVLGAYEPTMTAVTGATVKAWFTDGLDLPKGASPPDRAFEVEVDLRWNGSPPIQLPVSVDGVLRPDGSVAIYGIE